MEQVVGANSGDEHPAPDAWSIRKTSIERYQLRVEHLGKRHVRAISNGDVLAQFPGTLCKEAVRHLDDGKRKQVSVRDLREFCRYVATQDLPADSTRHLERKDRGRTEELIVEPLADS